MAGRKVVSVDDFMRDLVHPQKAEIEMIRRIILGADAGITESIKWNAPSFHFKEYFATCHLRAKGFVQIVFHMGAKARADGKADTRIKDPAGLLEWLAKDRGITKFQDGKDFRARRKALEDIVRQWIKLM